MALYVTLIRVINTKIRLAFNSTTFGVIVSSYKADFKSLMC